MIRKKRSFTPPLQQQASTTKRICRELKTNLVLDPIQTVQTILEPFLLLDLIQTLVFPYLDYNIGIDADAEEKATCVVSPFTNSNKLIQDVKENPDCVYPNYTWMAKDLSNHIHPHQLPNLKVLELRCALLFKTASAFKKQLLSSMAILDKFVLHCPFLSTLVLDCKIATSVLFAEWFKANRNQISSLVVFDDRTLSKMERLLALKPQRLSFFLHTQLSLTFYPPQLHSTYLPMCYITCFPEGFSFQDQMVLLSTFEFPRLSSLSMSTSGNSLSKTTLESHFQWCFAIHKLRFVSSLTSLTLDFCFASTIEMVKCFSLALIPVFFQLQHLTLILQQPFFNDPFKTIWFDEGLDNLSLFSGSIPHLSLYLYSSCLSQPLLFRIIETFQPLKMDFHLEGTLSSTDKALFIDRLLSLGMTCDMYTFHF
jgi:hypothetical protein